MLRSLEKQSCRKMVKNFDKIIEIIPIAIFSRQITMFATAHENRRREINMYDVTEGTSSKRRMPRGIGRSAFDRGYEARMALDLETMRDAQELRYRSYLTHGHIASNTSGLFADKYDDYSTSLTIVVYATGRAVGSVRTCLVRRNNDTRCPARDSFPAEVDEILANCASAGDGYEVVEVNRLVRAPEAEDDQGLVFMLHRLAGRIGISAGFKIALSCVRLHHLPFYRRIGWVQAGEPRAYPGLRCPMALIKLPRPQWDAAREAFPLMDPDAGAPGLLDGLEHGRTVRPHLVQTT